MTKLTELPEATTITSDDYILVTDDPGGTPISKRISKANFDIAIKAQFDTRAAAIAATIPSDINALRIMGYTTVGDGGESVYKKVGTPAPVEAWHFQSADGAYWELVPGEQGVNVKQLGATGDGVTDDLAAFEAARDFAQNNGEDGTVAAIFIPTPDDYYSFSSKLACNAEIYIQGSSHYSCRIRGDFDGPVIEFQTGSNKSIIENLTIANANGTGGALKWISSHRSAARNIYLYAQAIGGIGFYNQGSQHLLLENCYCTSNGKNNWPVLVAGGGDYGFYFEALTGANTINKSLLKHCESAGMNISNFALDATADGQAAGAYMTLMNSTFQGSTSNGNININDAQHVSFHACHCEASDPDIILVKAHNFHWSGGRVGNINISNTEGCTFTSCQIDDFIVDDSDSNRITCINSVLGNSQKNWGSRAFGKQNDLVLINCRSKVEDTPDSTGLPTLGMYGTVLNYNGNFEKWDSGLTKPIGYEAVDGATLSRSTTEVDGTYACEITSTGANQYPGIQFDTTPFYQDIIPRGADTTNRAGSTVISAMARVRRNSNNTVTPAFVVDYGFRVALTPNASYFVDDEFETLIARFPNGNGPPKIILTIGSNAPNGESIIVDRMTVSMGPLPQDYAIGHAEAPDGLYVQQRRVKWENAVPTTGEWVQGETVFNSEPLPGEPVGWICTVSGSPGTWKVIGMLSDTDTFETRTAAIAASIPSDYDVIKLLGYSTAGDGGEATYKRIGTPAPVEAWHFQSADGAYWELVPDSTGVDVRCFGAVDDDSTDNTTAIQNAFDFNPGLVIFGGDGIYQISDTITVPSGCNIDMLDASMHYVGTRDRTVLVLGAANTLNQSVHIRNLDVRSATLDWSNTDYVGVRAYCMSVGRIQVKAIRGFNIGLECYSEGKGYAYTTHLLDNIGENKHGVTLTCDGTSGGDFVNENTFYGGNYTVSSSTAGLGDCYGIWFRSINGGYKNHNCNRFYAPCFQMQNGNPGDERIPMLFDKCGTDNRVYDARYETGRGPFARLEGDIGTGGGSDVIITGNRFDVNYTSGANTTTVLTETYGARNNLVTVADRRSNDIIEFQEIYKYVKAYNSANVALSGGLISGVSTSNTKLVTNVPINVYKDSIRTGFSRSIGFYVDNDYGSHTYLISVNADNTQDANGLARPYVQVLDGDWAVLDNTSPTFPDAVLGESTNYEVYTPNWGKAYYPGGDTTTIVFRVTDSVKYIFVASAGGTGDQRLKNIKLERLSYDSKPMRLVIPPDLDYDIKNHYATDPTSGIGGIYERGEIILDHNAATGTANNYWQCTTAGRMAPAWVGSTQYVAGALVLNDTNKIYECVTSGISNTTVGPTGTGTGITDNNAVWDYLSPLAVLTPRESIDRDAAVTFNANVTVSGTDLTLDTVLNISVANTVANLPTPTEGKVARVNDANTPAVGSTVVGGGSASALVWYNGSNWTVIGV
jgi:hypothetical protein